MFLAFQVIATWLSTPYCLFPTPADRSAASCTFLLRGFALLPHHPFFSLHFLTFYPTLKVQVKLLPPQQSLHRSFHPKRILCSLNSYNTLCHEYSIQQIYIDLVLLLDCKLFQDKNHLLEYFPSVRIVPCKSDLKQLRVS